MKRRKAKDKPSNKNTVLGRPTLFDESFCQLMIDYFNKPLYEKKRKPVLTKTGTPVEIEVEVPASFPTFEGFARSIGTSHQTLHNWSKKHDSFFDAYNQCKGIQKEFIIEHGLMGGYNPAFAKFIAINVTDLKETIPVATDDKGNVIQLKYSLEEKKK